MAATKEQGVKASGSRLFVGLDVGSSFVHGVVLAEDGSVVYSPDPIMHFANPLGAIAEVWRDITSRFDPSSIVSTALTGSAAESFPRVMHGALYVYDSVAIPKGAQAIAPTAKYLFHIGAKDSYFFSLGTAAGRKIIVEWRTGTKCGGGSGMLVEKQCRQALSGRGPRAPIGGPGDASDGAGQAAARGPQPRETPGAAGRDVSPGRGRGGAGPRSRASSSPVAASSCSPTSSTSKMKAPRAWITSRACSGPSRETT